MDENHDVYDVFMSYRRADTQSAGRLHDRLKERFTTFYDRAIPRGSVFAEKALHALGTAPVVIAVIDKGWMSPENLQRLHSGEDWLRRELEVVVSRTDGVHLIPVLIDDVAMPEEKALPAVLHPLCGHQAMCLRADSWDRDVEALMDEIKTSLAKAVKSGRSRRGTNNSDGPRGQRSAGVPWFIAALIGLFFLAAGMSAGSGWDWLRSRIGPDALVPAHALGLVGYHRQMLCDLSLDAGSGATVTIYTTFVRGLLACKRRLEAALLKGVKFRFLLIHPYAATADLRASEFKGRLTLDDFRDEVASCMVVLHEIRQELQARQDLRIDDALQVRVYGNLPNMPLHVVHYEKRPQDDVIYQGFFLPYGTGAPDLPAEELRHPRNPADSILFDQLRAYVDEKWEDSTPIDLSVGHTREDWLKTLKKIPVRYRVMEPSAAPSR